LSLAVTSCLLALSNATYIGVSGNTQVNYKISDYDCHNIPTMSDSSNGLSVLVYQGPAYAATFYSSSDCKSGGKTFNDIGGPWQRTNGPIKSYRLVKPYTTAIPPHSK
ncbi:hypothetical protein GGI21_001770, partial [Coemansia aciculifera]